MSALAGKSQAMDRSSNGALAGNSILEEFCRDRESIEALKVTPKELEALSRAALLGTLSCKDDILFVLRQVRKPLIIDDTDQQQLPPDVRQMTETIRLAAFAQLTRVEALDSRPSRRALRGIKLMLSAWRGRSSSVS